MNAFGKDVFPISYILRQPHVRDVLRQLLTEVFSGIGATTEQIVQSVDISINNAELYPNMSDYERQTRLELERIGVLELLKQKIHGRAQKMVSLCLLHVVGTNVLDLGCGPGEVGALLCFEKGFEAVLTDVYQSVRPEYKTIPFVTLKQGPILPFFDNTFYNILIFAMLHHTSSPMEMVRDSVRVLKRGGRLHVIETVYGVTPLDLLTKQERTDKDVLFASLSAEEQRLVTMFLDYFGNHVSWYYSDDPTQKVPVPYNFNTPSNWRDMFAQHGCRVVHQQTLGVDPGSGVFHVMFVFEKK